MYLQEDLYRVLKIKDSPCMEQYAFSYFFSYSNICQVCFSHERDTRLKRCTRCKMVYYCGKEHQKIHWLTHKDFCNVATRLLTKLGGLNLFDKMKTEDQQDRINWKNYLVDCFETDLKRKLIPSEKSLIFFPKLCAICYESDPSRLIFCHKCPHASFCKKHFEDAASHVNNCKLFSQGLLSNAIGITFKAEPIPGIITSVPYNTKKVYLPSGMQDFLDYYCKCKKSFLKDFKRSEIQTYMSEHFSRPLTLLYALEKLRHPRQQSMTIHVIGANNFEEVGQLSWELLFHWLTDLVSLKIVLIGPECSKSTQQIALCKVCVGSSKRLHFESHEMLYKNYWESEAFTKPNIVIGFNAGLKIYPTWIDSLLMLKKVNCPFILTTYYEREIDSDHEVMLKVFGHLARYTFRQINPFASLRPYRDVVNTKVFYRNTGIMMYTKLGQKAIQTNLSGLFLNNGNNENKIFLKEEFERKADSVVLFTNKVNHYQIEKLQEEEDYLVIFYHALTIILICFTVLFVWNY